MGRPGRHSLLAAAYLSAAVLVTAALIHLKGTEIVAAIALGGVVATAGVLAQVAQLILAGRRPDPEPQLRQAIVSLDERVEQLAAKQDKIARELVQARGEARQIFEALAEAGRAGGGLGDVVAEVRVLRRLVEQLREAQEAAPPVLAASVPIVPAAAAGPAPAARTAKPVKPAAAPAPRSMLDVVQDALASGRIDLVLQPIVSLPQRRRQFYECFSRIRDDAGQTILPEQYLDTAASIGLLPAIDNLLLFRCIQMIRRARPPNTGIGFFCNISSHSLADRDFLRDVLEFLGDNRDLAENIILETAQASLDFESAGLKLQMDRLAEIGVRFSLDFVMELPLDYARLADWHVRFVKVPAGRFAETDPQGPWEGSLFQLRRMLGLHGIELIVEKIETDQQLLELLEFNIAFGQGYLFGEPKPAPEF